ncbi:hypothetical protein E4U43_007137 [Claviceps pusilla]|uniref:Uncharacterized protein n=1 Tax=Claviceps pusilla TaxID=123648 RepID=A0A9P7SZC1_9HYPO|nr:hypothetical protein E4U43_007137 [Claviceps pusilla]
MRRGSVGIGRPLLSPQFRRFKAGKMLGYASTKSDSSDWEQEIEVETSTGLVLPLRQERRRLNRSVSMRFVNVRHDSAR